MSYQVRGLGFSLIFTLLLTACATAPVNTPPAAAPVFPAPPDEPRFVYERSLSFNDDIEEKPDLLERLKRYATGESADKKGLIKPYGVAAYQGRVYVTDTVQRVVILFDIPGHRYREFGLEGPGQLLKPIGIAISPARGEIFVSDVTARHILVYDLEGNYRRTLGDSSLLHIPSGVTLSPDGTRLYVVDTGGVDNPEHHIYVLDAATGQLINTIGKRGTGDGEFNLPLQAATGPDGTLYVVDKGNFRIQAFKPDGSFAMGFGEPGRFPGQFASPKGIATDAQGNIYVVDVAFGNVQIFNKQGQVLMFIGDRGQSGLPAKYMLPAGISVDDTGRIYVVDQYFRKVDVFKPVERFSAPPMGAAATSSSTLRFPPAD